MATILVVDDRPMNRQFLATLLGRAQHRVIEAGDGEEALEKAREDRPDLVITDIVMPQMDGVEFTKRIVDELGFAPSKVIFYSASYRLREATKLAAACGVTRVIAKPSKTQRILQEVSIALGAGEAYVPRPLPPEAETPRATPGMFSFEEMGERLADHLGNALDLNARMALAVEEGRELAESREAHGQLTVALRESLEELQAVTLRLAGLLEFGLELAAARRPDELIVLSARAAQDLITARCSVVGMVDPVSGTVRHLASRGLSRLAESALRAEPAPELVREILADPKVRRGRALPGDPAAAGLPPDHPSVHDLLAVPISTTTQGRGFLYLVDRLGQDGFTDDDERLALTLAAQIGIAYENLMLYAQLQQHVAELQAATGGWREAEDKYRRIFENATFGMFQTTLEGKMLAANPALARLLGYGSPTERLNAETDIMARHIVDPERREDLIQHLAEHGHVAGFTLQLRRVDGALIWVRITARAVVGADGVLDHFEGMMEDITDAKRLEEQYLHSQKLEGVGRLAGGVAHDFNNLLTVILSRAEFVREDLPPDSPLRGDVDEIRKAADRAALLTRQLLSFARRQVVQPRLLDLNDVALNMDKMLRRLIGTDIELVTLLQNEPWAVRADPSQIEQVIVNLAVNARDAMPKGGKLTTETANVTLGPEYAATHPEVTPGDYVMLGVSDTGEGMSEEVRLRIFDPFFTTKAEGKGTGLGLSTVYGVVNQAGGHIWVYSEPGLGTTFKVYLPRAMGAAEHIRAAQPGPVPRGSETVLVVEDELQVLSVASRTLTGLGYRVLEAHNGLEALRIVDERGDEIDLLLTDLVMPQMSGKDLAIRLIGRHPRLKVLYTSGYAGQAVVRLDASATLLPKPYTPATLAREVREVLDRDV